VAILVSDPPFFFEPVTSSDNKRLFEVQTNVKADLGLYVIKVLNLEGEWTRSVLLLPTLGPREPYTYVYHVIQNRQNREAKHLSC
jgi:hypothetical protein